MKLKSHKPEIRQTIGQAFAPTASTKNRNRARNRTARVSRRRNK